MDTFQGCLSNFDGLVLSNCIRNITMKMPLLWESKYEERVDRLCVCVWRSLYDCLTIGPGSWDIRGHENIKKEKNRRTEKKILRRKGCIIFQLLSCLCECKYNISSCFPKFHSIKHGNNCSVDQNIVIRAIFNCTAIIFNCFSNNRLKYITLYTPR